MKTKIWTLPVLLFAASTMFTACNKKLPKEEQQKLMEEANARKIQRVTESQMVEYVQKYGEQLIELSKSGTNPQSVTDEMIELLGNEHIVEYDLPEASTTEELQEVMEAYMFSIAEGNDPGANIQLLDNGNILYTIPQIRDSAGIKVLSGLWKIEFLRKQMVNDIATAE